MEIKKRLFYLHYRFLEDFPEKIFCLEHGVIIFCALFILWFLPNKISSFYFDSGMFGTRIHMKIKTMLQVYESVKAA